MKTWTKSYLLPLIPALLVSTSALAQDWAPSKQVAIVAAAGAGGGLDMVARTMAKVFDAKKIVTQPITVENKPGGGQVTGTVEFATKEARNDHKMLIVSTPFILNHIKRDGNSPIGPVRIPSSRPSRNWLKPSRPTLPTCSSWAAARPAPGTT